MIGNSRNFGPRVFAATVIVALVGLSGSTAHAVISLTRANDRVSETREQAMALRTIRDAVADEAFAEAAYRRAPNSSRWSTLESSIAAVPALVAQVRPSLGRTDGVTLSHLTVLNQRYAEQIRETRDVRVGAATDDRVAGPALDTMQELLDALLVKHRAAITAAMTDQAAITRGLSYQLPIVFLIAFGVLSWAARLFHREHRRLRRESAQHFTDSRTDALTGLPNRAALIQSLEDQTSALVEGSAVLFLDLDHFKPVNDTWGHHAGDVVLREVANRLRGVLRSGDLAARLGGDEFVVHLVNGSDAEVVANRILAAFAAPFVLDEQASVSIGTSIGIARIDASCADVTDLLQTADKALYAAKEHGRGRAAFISHAV